MLEDAAAVRTQAAAWVARQVSRDAIVACDPGMCSALLAQGVMSGNLLELGASTPDPLGSDVVVATPAVRSQFGGRLASVYAPGILATFGSGGLRIDVRAIAPDGAAAYQAAVASDLAARRDAGRQLLGNPHLRVSAAARAALRAGQVDPRLLTTLATLAATTLATTGPVEVSAFGDSGPGASPGMPLRSAQLTVPSRADLGRLRGVVAFVRAQRPPYLPAQALITTGAGGSPALSIGFSAPSPAGLLQAWLTGTTAGQRTRQGTRQRGDTAARDTARAGADQLRSERPASGPAATALASGPAAAGPPAGPVVASVAWTCAAATRYLDAGPSGLAAWAPAASRSSRSASR